MKTIENVLFFLIFLAFLSCKQKENATSNTTINTSQDTTVQKVSVITCETKGNLKESFTQNGATFERFEIVDKEQEWLKISSKTGSCIIIDSIREANHYSCRFEDWDGDGMKDRIDQGKWNYTVQLFSKEKNDFSRKVKGYFSGEQLDFDKTKGLKWQFLEDKFGGTYELYKMNDVQKVIYSQIHFTQPEDVDIPEIEIRKNIVETADDFKFDSVKFDKKAFLIKPISKVETYDTQLERWHQSVERYWRKHLADFIK